MITVVCGEDVISSRDYYNRLKQNSRDQGDEVKNIASSALPEISHWQGSAPTLFSNKTVFFTEYVNKKLGRTTKELKETVEKIAKDTNTDLIVWEEVSARELKLGKLVTVKEFKPTTSIFQLLDLCVPGKKTQFIETVKTLMGDMEATFIFLMLIRHMRKILLAKSGTYDKGTAPWQRGKLAAQAKAWEQTKLISFYDTLHRIDIGLKTGGSPYTLQQSLDILALYFL